ncbi:MAG: cytochrome CBB3 [Porticoccaceae bacterium]|nr:MAG: cytochrome CBB3 [Porticoccaceae bacterium]
MTADNRRAIPTSRAGLAAADLSRLRLAWVFGLPDAVRFRSHPALAGGAVYLGSQDGRVFALERKTGCVRWVFRARGEVRTAVVVAPWRAGDRTARPLAYFGDYLGNVYAVDAASGELRWQVRPDPHPSAVITGSPTLHEGVLYVPVSSLEVLAAQDPAYHCCTFRGAVVALDADTGAERFRVHTVTEPATPRGANRLGTPRFGPAGAPVWGSPAVDARRRQLLFGTGQNYSRPATATSDAIFAVDLDSGRVRWIFQATADDVWNAACEVDEDANCPEDPGPDYDFGAPPLLARGADGRDYVLAGQKSGWVYALDPDDGRLRWKVQVGAGGLNGGVHFGMAAAAGRLFVPISDADLGRHHVPREPRPGLYALDVATGALLWQWPAPDVCAGRVGCKRGNGQAVAVAGDLVFAGSIDGHLRVHDARTGAVLWDFDSAREWPSVNGVPARGGSFEGAASPVVDRGWLYFGSGYLFHPYMPGNAFFAFAVVDEDTP